MPDLWPLPSYLYRDAGLVLISFLGVRIYTDFSGGNHLVGIVDLALSVPILLFFVAHAQSS